MNVGNDNTEPSANLELSLSYSNHRISTRSSDQGAGVNAAASRVDMSTFVASDRLSELVWSPHNGLSLKLADSSFAEKLPLLIWDVGPSKFVDKEKLISSENSLVVTPGLIEGVMTPIKSTEEYLVENGGDLAEVNSTGEALVVHTGEKSNADKSIGEGISGKNCKSPQIRNSAEFLSLETGGPLLYKDKDSMMPIQIPTSSSQGGRDKDPPLDTEIEKKNEIVVDPLERLECTAENELSFNENALCENEELLSRGKSIQREASPTSSKTPSTKKKGKAKVSSKSKDGNDSDESVESCNSVRLSALGKKRWRFEENLILGSKRLKTQIHESSSSTSFMGQQSSFMNWISNMVKGLNRTDQDKGPSQALVLANSNQGNDIVDPNIVVNQNRNLGSSDIGFHNMFKSVCCLNLKEKDRKVPIESNELVLAKLVGPNITPISCYQEKTISCDDVADGRNSSSSDNDEERTKNADDKCDNLENLWITRFCPKPHGALISLDNSESSFSSKFKKKEVVASEFAMKLDEFKVNIPSDMKNDKAQTIATCFYCGRSGHDLLNCWEIIETERKKFISNIGSLGGLEESRCLCIRCFQLDHWAISCPRALIIEKQNQSFSGTGKAMNLGLENNMSKEEKLHPSCNLVNGQLPEAPNGTFDAVRKLRLSRTDILKWMNSHSSVSCLDGYFLRLRLGKGENGLVGTRYYVASITGEQSDKLPQGSRKLISVYIEGKSCLVESQYISNQDFIEDELMAWWSTIGKSGGRFPSEYDLERKLIERKRLGV